MIRSTPCKLYIKYLIAHPDAYSLEDIQRILKEHQLDYPGAWPIERFAQELKSNKPTYYKPYDSRHSESFRYLVSHGIYRFFHPDKATQEAFKILKSPRAKELVESMSIARDPEKFIRFRLKDLKLEVSEEGLKRYFDFFWNLDLVDRVELGTLITMRIESMALDGHDALSPAFYNAAKKSQYKDPRVAALNSISPQFASVFNQIRHGYMPQELDLPALLSRAREVMILRLIEASADMGLSSTNHMMNISVALKSLNEFIEAIGSPDESLQQTVMGLILDTDAEDVPDIKSLTAGNVTTSLQPIEEHHVE